MNRFFRRPKTYKDSGFGEQNTTRGARLINKDGSFNVWKKGLPLWKRFSFFHTLITMSQWRFVVFILVSYFLINLFFALIYFIIGVEHLSGGSGATWSEQFLDTFYFSTQTFTTLGYGHISPTGRLTSLIAAVEALVGLMGFALATGLLYGRFSRPRPKIIFSQKALIAPYREGKALMFRVGNGRDSDMSEVSCEVLLSQIEGENDQEKRNFYRLDLEIDRINFLATTWTVVHPIDEDSPLHEKRSEDMHKRDAEVMILLKGYDDTFAQVVNTRTSYKFDEILWDAKFTPIDRGNSGGKHTIDFGKLGHYEEVSSN